MRSDFMNKFSEKNRKEKKKFSHLILFLFHQSSCEEQKKEAKEDTT